MQKIVLGSTVDYLKPLLKNKLPAIQPYNPEGFEPCVTMFKTVPISESNFRLFGNFKFDQCAVSQFYSEPLIPESIKEQAEKAGNLFYGVPLTPFIPKKNEKYVWLGGARVMDLFFLFFFMKKENKVCCIHGGIYSIHRTILTCEK